MWQRGLTSVVECHLWLTSSNAFSKSFEHSTPSFICCSITSVRWWSFCFCWIFRLTSRNLALVPKAGKFGTEFTQMKLEDDCRLIFKFGIGMHLAAIFLFSFFEVFIILHSSFSCASCRDFCQVVSWKNCAGWLKPEQNRGKMATNAKLKTSWLMALYILLWMVIGSDLKFLLIHVLLLWLV